MNRLLTMIMAGLLLAAEPPKEGTGNDSTDSHNKNNEQSESLNRTALPQPEILCQRTDFGKSTFMGSLASFFTGERPSDEGKKASRNRYGLSSVTVPLGGWKIHAIAIYTFSPSRPEGWLKVRQARLNVFPKKGDLPTAEDDPRTGRVVEVTVRESQKGSYEIRASDLDLTLKSAEYWIGLTPIYSDANGRAASHLLARIVHDAPFDDVFRAFGADDLPPEERNWTRLGPGTHWTLGEHFSVRIEGWRLQRGEILDWPPEKVKGAKQLYPRFGTFDPLAESPKIPKELTASDDGKLWIVQCQQMVDQQARDQITRAGATLLRYLPDDAYIVRLAPDAVEAIRRFPVVRWVGPYHAAFRLDPNVFPEPLTNNWSFVGMRSQLREPKSWRYVLVHLFDRDVGAKKVVGQVIRDAGGKVVFESPRGFYLAANVPLDRLAAVAQCEAVCGVERRFGAFDYSQAPSQGDKSLITLAQIRELCGAEAINKAGGYEGLGVRVAFWDDRVREDHVDLLSRPVTILGPTQWTNANHGTAIASILCGEGRGDPRARGLLPLGGLVFAADRGDALHEDRYSLVDQFVRDHHAVVLSSSVDNWGGQMYIKHYDGYSFLLDDLVLEHDLLICEAIGNTTGSGNGKSGSWAKNAINVGGVDPRGTLRREDHRHNVFTSGPALDGRVKPDLVHFGSRVYCANASSPRGYGEFGGTSCATPLVAGHCGLMMEMWADGVFGNLPLGQTVFDRKPHAATAKALMINSAYRYPIDERKSALTRFRQGWGMPDLGRLYESRKKLFVVDQEVALRDHEAMEYRLRVPENEPELRATLVYSDPLGTTTAAKALVNDLDLIVTAPDGKRYFGNHGLLESNFSKEGGAPDRVNNVENVFLDKPAPGVWRVIVAAHRIAWDQHRGTEAWDQDFALVVGGVQPDLVSPDRQPK
jgi:hypothetical protein